MRRHAFQTTLLQQLNSPSQQRRGAAKKQDGPPAGHHPQLVSAKGDSNHTWAAPQEKSEAAWQLQYALTAAIDPYAVLVAVSRKYSLL